MSESYLRPGPGCALPSPEQIRGWWDDYGMLENIKRHSERVCQVALLLYAWLDRAGVELFRPAVEAGALAHDIAKAQCLGTRRSHAKEGGEILEQKGYPELAYLVRNHVYLSPDHPLDETMVVTYADKRVNHDTVVSLDDRFAYILGNYGQKYPEHIPYMLEGKKQAFGIERKIFKRLNNSKTPQDILIHFREDS